MGYSIDFKVFDKNMRLIREREGALCFGSELEAYADEGEKYFTYYIKKCKFTKQQVLDYTEFLKKITYFKKIDFSDVVENLQFTFDITKTNSLHMFLVLTVLRYLEEDTRIVKFILLNKDNPLAKVKILLLSSYYSTNTGHCISMYPTEEMVRTYKTKRIRKIDNKILSRGLQDYYFVGGSWLKSELFDIFKVKKL